MVCWFGMGWLLVAGDLLVRAWVCCRRWWVCLVPSIGRMPVGPGPEEPVRRLRGGLPHRHPRTAAELAVEFLRLFCPADLLHGFPRAAPTGPTRQAFPDGLRLCLNHWRWGGLCSCPSWSAALLPMEEFVMPVIPGRPARPGNDIFRCGMQRLLGCVRCWRMSGISCLLETGSLLIVACLSRWKILACPSLRQPPSAGAKRLRD